MNKNQQKTASKATTCCTWRHFDNKAYSAFRSISREVRIGVLAVATLASAGMAQAAASSETTINEEHGTGMVHELEELEVTGSLAPLQANQAARIVTTIGREEIAQAAAQSVNDLLKLALGIDVRQRGAFGVQTDISIDGGTFDQVTILLNGVNIGSPQTGHLSADFPVAIEDIVRIEVLEGAASRSVGGSSFSGAVNIVTKPDSRSHVAVNAQGGSYGSFGAGARANYSNNVTQHQFSFGYRRSDGGTTNSAFDKGNAFYQGNYTSREVDVNWQLGYSNQDYGANTFYSAAYPNQHEQNSRYFVAVKAATKGSWLHLEPTIYWTRSTDHFELIHRSDVGENFHRSDVYGGRLNSYFRWAGGVTSVGAEVRNEGILSTNLGRPLEESEYVKIPGHDGYYDKHDNRTNVSYFGEHNIVLRNFTLSMGVVANMNTALDSRFRWYPGVDLSYRPNQHWQLTASWNKAFRMPTFTDLYYKSPTTEGNIGLKPEQTQSFMLSARYRSQAVNATLRGFYHKGKDMIDWVMYSADDKYHSANFKLDNLGAELQTNFNLQHILGPQQVLQNLSLGYTYIHQKRHDDAEVFKSSYALDYLRHKFTARLTHRIWGALSASWNLRWQDRLGGYLEYVDAKPTGELIDYKPYAVLDLKLQFTKPTYELWVSANNLTDHTYYDFGNIPQPGLWIMAGGSYRFNF
ncbi:MAG: TonB-dependent receptor plug domain-containing protein [Muribaculaceae bacterium]